MPKVSIVLPVHNGEHFIAQAIKSVENQSFQDWELCVVDDGSTDGTKTVVGQAQSSDPRIRYVSEESKGIQKALNKGLAMARGQYVARIDDDDRWIEPDKLARQVAFLDKHGEYALVGTGAVVRDERGVELSRFLNPETDEAIRRSILGKNCFTHSSVLFRKDIIRDIGGYDESSGTLHVEDYDLWLRVGKKRKFANLPIYGISWTLRASGTGFRNKLEQFKNALAVSRRHRHAYPNAWGGALRHCARIALYGIFSLIPGAVLRQNLVRFWARAFRRAL